MTQVKFGGLSFPLHLVQSCLVFCVISNVAGAAGPGVGDVCADAIDEVC